MRIGLLLLAGLGSLPASAQESRGAAQFIVEMRRETPAMAPVLADLSGPLAQALSLEFLIVDEGNRIELRGLTKNGPALLAALEESRSLGKPRLAGPGTVDSFSGKERVTVFAPLNPRGDGSADTAADAFLASAESAHADLLRRLAAAMEAAKTSCEILSRQEYGGGYRDGYRGFALQARIRCTRSAFEIAPVVAELERAKPYVFVRDLKIAVRTMGYRAAEESSPHGRIDVTFTLVGYVQRPAQLSRPSPWLAMCNSLRSCRVTDRPAAARFSGRLAGLHG